MLLGENFHKFMCNSVAPRIGDEKFQKAAERWRVLLSNHFHKFMCDGVAACISNE